MVDAATAIPGAKATALDRVAAAGVVRAFVPAGSKPTLEAAGILAAKAAAVVFTVQIPAGSPGVSAAPAGNIGAVAAVPGAKTAAVSKLWAFGFVHHIGVNLIQKQEGGLRRVWPKIIRLREEERYSSFLARVIPT